jgi:predicted GH43/DUF377 family glycosyl hydrolase
MTADTPSDETERSVSRPEMVFTTSSILSETSLSISCGAAPGSVVVTTTMGKSMSGKRSTPNCV